MNTNLIPSIISRASQFAATMSEGEAFFAAAREAGVPENEVAAIAQIASCVQLNEEINRPLLPATVEAIKAAEASGVAIRALVSAWAKATGRTGGKNKQTRQCRIRNLLKHGVNSAYADRLRAEAGIV